MATISYKCDTCKRTTELVENAQGFTVVGKCVITNGCTGRLYKTERNPNNVRESSPSYVEGLDNYVPRRAFYQFSQTLSSNKWKVVHDMGVLPSTFVYLEQEDGSVVQVDNSTYTVSVIDKNSIFVIFPNKVRGVIQCVAKSTVPLVPSTIPVDVNLIQVSTNGIITFAVPKYLTQVSGTVPSVTPPSITPTITPSPTPTSTPIGLPLNLCATNAAIQIEIEITRPNEDPFVCFEDISNLTDNRSPWSGWGEVLVRKRKNYCVRTVSLLKLKVFGNADLEAGDIPNGTRIRFLRIDYGTGRKEVIPSRGLLMLLASSPYAYADKIKNKLIDVGELLGDTPDYFVYQNGELFLDETKIERSYPDISRVIYQPAPPQPSPTPTPTVTPAISPTISLTPTPTVTASVTPTPTATGPTTPTPTATVTPEATPTPTVTPSVTEAVLGHTFWRINISSTRTIDGIFASIQEIEFRDTVGGSTVTSGGTPFASTSVASGPGNYSPYAAFDGITTGDTESFWSMPSSTPIPCAIGYEFASPVNIVEVSLFSGASSTRAARMPRDFTLDWSDDGVAWTPVMTIIDAPAFGVYEEQIFTV